MCYYEQQLVYRGEKWGHSIQWPLPFCSYPKHWPPGSCGESLWFSATQIHLLQGLTLTTRQHDSFPFTKENTLTFTIFRVNILRSWLNKSLSGWTPHRSSPFPAYGIPTVFRNQVASCFREAGQPLSKRWIFFWSLHNKVVLFDVRLSMWSLYDL